MDTTTLIDTRGYRPGVAIIVVNQHNQLFWARRVGQEAWQFPQGGLHPYETAKEAMYRELHEEVGLQSEDVQVIGISQRWLRYRLPSYLIRHHSKPVCIGQKQKWFLLRLLTDDSHVHFDKTNSPEFDHFCWVDYWHPLEQVISFKRAVYRQILQEFEPLLFSKPCHITNVPPVHSDHDKC